MKNIFSAKLLVFATLIFCSTMAHGIYNYMTFSQPSKNTVHQIKGTYFNAEIDVEQPQQLLKVTSLQGETIYTFRRIRLVQDGKTYVSNFSEFTPRMHILRNGPYFNEVHIQNIVLTVPGEGIHWPGLVEYTMTFYQDRIYHLVTFKANNQIVIMTPIIGRGEGVGRRGYVAREGFTDCPEVSPSSLQLLLDYGAEVPNSALRKEAIYVDNLNTVSLPTWPESVSEQTVANSILTLRNQIFNVPWNPGRREQIGLLTAFGTRSEREKLIDLEVDPLTDNEIIGGGFLGFNPRNGLYQFSMAVVANDSSPRIHPLGFANKDKPRTIFIEHETRGNISAGLVLDENQIPLQLVTQQSLNFPNAVGTAPDQTTETGNSTKIFPIVLEAMDERNFTLMNYGTHFSGSDNLRATTWLNTLSQGRGSPILQTSLYGNENTTFRFDGSTYITDFRPHRNNRIDSEGNVASSAHSAINSYLSYQQSSGERIGLRTTDVRILHTGPFFSEFEADVESEDSALKGVLKVTIPGTSDHNRVIYELSLEAVENVLISSDNITPLTFFRLDRPGPPINYRNYAFLRPNGTIVSGNFNQNSDNIYESSEHVATNGFMAMYNANNIIRNGLTASQLAGNPMLFIKDWDVVINGQTVTPGAFIYTEKLDGTWGTRGVALKSSDPISSIQKGSTIKYTVVAYTGGDETTGPEDAMIEREAWKDGFKYTVSTGSVKEHYYPWFNAQGGEFHAVIEGGKDWIPVKVGGFEPERSIFATVTDTSGQTRDLGSDMPGSIWYSAWQDHDGKKGIAFTVPMMDHDSVTLIINQDPLPPEDLGKIWLGTNGTGGSGVWNLDDRWNPNQPTAEDSALFNMNSNALVNLGNLSPTIAGMIINKTGTTEFWTSGGSTRTLTFGSDGLQMYEGAETVTFRETATERVNPRISASQTWQNNSISDLIVGASLTAINAPTLTVTGLGDMFIGDRLGLADSPLNSLIKSGTGTLRINGNVFVETGSTVDGGSLILNGTHAGALTVSSGGTLGGIGTLGPTSVSGKLRPGGSEVGLLVFQDTLEFEGVAFTIMEIDGVTTRGIDYDTIDVTRENGLTYGGSLQLVFTGPAEVGSYHLFDFEGSSSGGLGNVTLAGSYDSSLSQSTIGIWSADIGELRFTFSEFSGNLTVAMADEPPLPSPPTISAIADQAISVNTSTGALSFTVGSEVADAATLTLSGSSSNATLVPGGNIVFGGSGTNRTLTVTPLIDQIGNSLITVTVSDGELTASVSFTLVVFSSEEPVVDVVVNPAGNLPAHFFLARAWHWDTDGDTEGWVAGVNGHLALDPGSPVWGLLSGTSTDVDPQWFSPSNLGILATEEMILEFRIRKQSADGTRMDLFWEDSTGNFGGDRLQSIPANALPRDGEFHVVRIHFSHAIQGILSRLRFDPISGSSGIGRSFDLDYLRIYATAFVESSTPPKLTIQDWEQNQVRLSWSSAATGWTLQSSANLDGAYSDAGLEVTVEGDENAAYDTVISARRFYRLTSILE